MLKDDVTPIFAETAQIRELFLAEQPELDAVEAAVAGWIRELYIMTADDTIEQWERDYGLDHNTGLALEERRARILAKKMQRRLPKRENMEEAIRQILGAGRVTVTEQNCKFTVRAESTVHLDKMAIAKEYFRQVRAAHFDYQFIQQVIWFYDVRLCYENRMYLSTKFFPRQNLEILRLDGTWKLDGTRRLSAYDKEKYIDFYPLRIKMAFPACIKIGLEEKAKAAAAYSAKAVSVQETKVCTEVYTHQEPGDHYRLCPSVSCAYKAEANTEEGHVKIWNKLDGTWKLDGSRKLNAGYYEL